jgi:hypothetical protein
MEQVAFLAARPQHRELSDQFEPERAGLLPCLAQCGLLEGLVVFDVPAGICTPASPWSNTSNSGPAGPGRVIKAVTFLAVMVQ